MGLIFSAWFICVPCLRYDFSMLISDGQCRSAGSAFRVIMICGAVSFAFRETLLLLRVWDNGGAYAALKMAFCEKKDYCVRTVVGFQ